MLRSRRLLQNQPPHRVGVRTQMCVARLHILYTEYMQQDTTITGVSVVTSSLKL